MVTKKALFSSENGRVECADHAPYRGSDTWHFGRYRRMTAIEQASLRMELDGIVRQDEPLCEICRGTARRAAAGAAR